MNGANIGTFREGDALRTIVKRPVETARDKIGALHDIRVFFQVIGDYVPISQFVDSFDLVFEAGNLRRIDRKLTITAQSDNAPGVLSGGLFDAVRAPIEAIALPPGYSFEWKGEFGNSAEVNEGLAATMPLGIGAIILIVIYLFNAVRQPLIIWLTVPLALISMMIKNAFVLLGETDSQIATGKARMQAVMDAAVTRVRPASLGVLTTVLGVMPLLWDPFFKSLAVVIIVGLSFGAILTLIVVPVLYTLFFRVKADEVSNPS